MQIREVFVAVEAPSPFYPSTVCQSILFLPRCPTVPPPSPSPSLLVLLPAHPNTPLGAGLCIFNKFRESSKPAVALKAAFWPFGWQTVSSRLFMCKELVIRLSQPSFNLILLAISSRSLLLPADLSHSLSLSPSSSPFTFSSALERLALHRPLLHVSAFSLFLCAPLTPAPLFLARALSRGAVSIRVWKTGNTGQRVCLLKTSF